MIVETILAIGGIVTAGGTGYFAHQLVKNANTVPDRSVVMWQDFKPLSEVEKLAALVVENIRRHPEKWRSDTSAIERRWKGSFYYTMMNQEDKIYVRINHSYHPTFQPGDIYINEVTIDKITYDAIRKVFDESRASLEVKRLMQLRYEDENNYARPEYFSGALEGPAGCSLPGYQILDPETKSLCGPAENNYLYTAFPGRFDR